MEYRCRKGLLVAPLLALFILASHPDAGRAQISGATVATSGCTRNIANNADGSTTCSAAIVTNNGTNLNTRYGGNVNADVGIFGNRTQTGGFTHKIDFNVTAPGGYRLDISTTRLGDINRINDLLNCDGSADTSGVTGVSSFPLSSGTLNLTDPGVINACGGIFGCGGGGTTNIPYNQSSGTAQLFRVSNGAAQSHSLTFTFTGSTTSNSCEAAVRVGEQNGTTTSCSACVYAGSPARTQATDGHFVNITRTSLCGNSVVDASVGEQCDLGAGNGQGGTCCTSTCQLRASGQSCRLPIDSCDAAETCTGSSPNCPADGFVAAGVTCRAASPGEVCDEDEECTGTGPNCPADQVQPNGTLCRASAGECDVAENCDGVSKFCPGDAKVPASTPCTSDGNPCTLDICNGVNNFCAHPAGNAGAVCRASAGLCDIQETCTGFSATCPADAFRPPSFTCRSAVDVCDQAENCPGGNPNCPPDVVKSSGTACTSDGNPCTLDQCDGVSTACQHPAGNAGAICRADAGDCDVAETCDGSNTACPADAFEPSGTACTDDGETCTIDECDGGGTCAHPAGNAGVECRGVTVGEECDEAEQCDGTNPTCPADGVQSAGTPCTDDGEVCTEDECDGSSKICQHPAGNAGTECRPDAGECDVAEQCDGSNPTCPGDGFEPSGTTCTDDGEVCTEDECDGNGACTHPAGNSGTPCASDGNPCTVDECDGISPTCSHPAGNAGTECRADAGECDVAEFCDGSNVTCPVNGFESNGTPCGSNNDDQCDDPDTCDGGGTCTVNNTASGTPCDDGLPCTTPDECDGSGMCIGDTSTCPLDHYKCYQGRDLKNPKFQKLTVDTSDQITPNQPAEVKKLKFVCVPVDKNGEGINDPNTHLACYQVKAANLTPRPSVEVNTQFQTSRFQLKKGKLLCLPATKTVLP